MPPEYDLVIIGASPEGMYAAQESIKHNKRVSLVEQGFNSQAKKVNSSILNQITCCSGQYNTLKSLGYFSEILPGDLFLETTQNLVQTISKTDFRADQLAVLAASGVDVILGSGSFFASPQLRALVQPD